MKYFFTTLRHVELIGFDSEYLDFLPGIRITNSQNIKNKILTKLIRDSIGILEANYIDNSGVFVYFEYEDNETLFKGLNNLQCLNMILIWIDDILKNSWIFKDNCIVCDTAYFIDNSKDMAEAASLRLQYIYTLSEGGIDKTVFSRNELLEFKDLHDKVEIYLYDKDSNARKFMLEKNFSRVGRALIFVKQAREARNLAYKIANYCSALETLFTTDNTELSHKLSERAAFFLKDECNRLETYKQIKKAYTIRSKLTHGASLDQKQIIELSSVSKRIDDILRMILIKILNSSEYLRLFDSSNGIDDFFEALIFS